MGNQVITLKHKPDRMIAVRIPIPVLIFLCGNTVNDQIAAVITVQAADNIKKRRLTGTTRPQNGNEFIIPEIQTDIVQCVLNQVPGDVFFANMLNLKHVSFSPFNVKCY